MKEDIQTMMEENRNDWWMKGRTAVLLELLKKYTNKKSKICDIGAGVGVPTQIVQEAGYKNIYAVDCSPTALKYLKKKGIKTEYGKLPNLKLKQKYDVVMMLDVLEHVQDDYKAIEKVSKALSKKGTVIVTVPAFQFLWTPKDEDLGHFRRYTKKQLKKVLTSSGLVVEYISYYNFFLFPLGLLYSIKNKKKTTTKRYNPKIDKIFGPIFSFEKHFIKYGIPFPVGISLVAILKKKDK